MPQINYRKELIFLPATTGVSSRFARQYGLFTSSTHARSESRAPPPTDTFSILPCRALLTLLPSTGSPSCPPPDFWCLIKPSLTALLTGAAFRVLCPPFRLCASPVPELSQYTDTTVRGMIRADWCSSGTTVHLQTARCLQELKEKTNHNVFF